MLVKAFKTGPRWETSLTKLVTERSPWGNVPRSNRVTTPKLFAPPLSAR